MMLADFTAALLVTLSFLGSPSEPGERLGLEILQESNGIPGREQEVGARQRILVVSDRLRLEDQATGVHYIFRLDVDPAQIWELTADGKKYREGVKGQIQVDRDRAERQTLEALKRGEPAELATYLRENYMRADGTREVVVQVSEDTPPDVLGYSVKRYVVRENERPVVDLLVTEDLSVEIPFFDFYRRVGAFSDEVLTELKRIRGVPLEARITVVTAGLSYPIHAKVVRLVQRPIDLARFELPPDATQIVDSPVTPCAFCGVDVENTAPGDKIIVNGKAILFCCREHRTAWRNKFGGKGAQAQPEGVKAPGQH
ncbi:MAG: hypothetical protein AB7O52_02105 [Planctomycetota bacterium]